MIRKIAITAIMLASVFLLTAGFVSKDARAEQDGQDQHHSCSEQIESMRVQISDLNVRISDQNVRIKDLEREIKEIREWQHGGHHDRD